MTQIKLLFQSNPINADGTMQKDVDFGLVLDQSFDNIPLKGNKNYSLYNELVINIRAARKNDDTYIEVERADLENLKNILIAATEGIPQLNRRVSFLCQVIDESINSHIVEKSK